MAIALDNSKHLWQVWPSATSLTSSFTCSWANRILFVSFYSAPTDNASWVTYGWVPMIQAGKILCPSDRWLYLYYLINPASWANNIVISTNTANYIEGYATSYTGAKQSWVPDAIATNTTTWTSLTSSVTTTIDNCRTVGAFKIGSAAVISAWTWLTIRSGWQASWLCLWDSNAPKTPAGSVSMTASSASPWWWASIMASFAPSIDTNWSIIAFFMS